MKKCRHQAKHTRFLVPAQSGASFAVVSSRWRSNCLRRCAAVARRMPSMRSLPGRNTHTQTHTGGFWRTQALNPQASHQARQTAQDHLQIKAWRCGDCMITTYTSGMNFPGPPNICRRWTNAFMGRNRVVGCSAGARCQRNLCELDNSPPSSAPGVNGARCLPEVADRRFRRTQCLQTAVVRMLCRAATFNPLLLSARWQRDVVLALASMQD